MPMSLTEAMAFVAAWLKHNGQPEYASIVRQAVPLVHTHPFLTAGAQSVVDQLSEEIFIDPEAMSPEWVQILHDARDALHCRDQKIAFMLGYGDGAMATREHGTRFQPAEGWDRGWSRGSEWMRHASCSAKIPPSRSTTGAMPCGSTCASTLAGRRRALMPPHLTFGSD